MVKPHKEQSSSKLVNDIEATLKKHKFSGTLFLKMADEDPENPCPNGGTPHEISVQLPNGTWESRIVCI
jgi:hypothetical protein